MSARCSRPRRALVALLALGVGLIPATGFGFDASGAKWRQRSMPVPFRVNHNLERGLDDGAVLDAIVAGFDVWAETNCSYLTVDYDGRTDSTAFSINDGDNVVSWRSRNWPDSDVALGVTSTTFDHNRFMLDADMIFNGVDHDWSTNGSQNASDVQSVAAHEAGHFFGMGHSRALDATMWPATTEGEITGRTLDGDDINGICAKYPNGEEPEEPEPDPDEELGGEEIGDDCGERGECQNAMFCISDGRSSYCSEFCNGNRDCPGDFICGDLRDGGGACVEGEEEPDPEPPRDIGQVCGPRGDCGQGRFCLDHSGDFYCSGPCERDVDCPDRFVCVDLQNGGGACAKGQRVDPEPEPEPDPDPDPDPEVDPDPDPDPDPVEPGPDFNERVGARCDDRGRCSGEYFCVEDVDGARFCTRNCDRLLCPNGFQCRLLSDDSERACLLATDAPADDVVGSDCDARGRCVGGLFCVEDRDGTRYCTAECTEGSCPEGFYCQGLRDDSGAACAAVAERPGSSDPDDREGSGGDVSSGGEGGGEPGSVCAIGPGSTSRGLGLGPAIGGLILLLGLRRR